MSLHFIGRLQTLRDVHVFQPLPSSLSPFIIRGPFLKSHSSPGVSMKKGPEIPPQKNS